jgi:hypothetical protein
MRSRKATAKRLFRDHDSKSNCTAIAAQSQSDCNAKQIQAIAIECKAIAQSDSEATMATVKRQRSDYGDCKATAKQLYSDHDSEDCEVTAKRFRTDCKAIARVSQSARIAQQ